MSIIKKGTNIKVKDTRFLLVINKDEKDLYILHRDFPRCLIYVESTTPVNFVVFDFFETDDNKDKAIAILTSESFKNDLRQYFIEQSLTLIDLN